MEEFVIRLNNVEDSYYDFIVAVLTYVKKKKSRADAVSKFMDDHPEAKTDDILDYISEQDDFYEDAAYARVEAG